jgi:hypothetical protein
MHVVIITLTLLASRSAGSCCAPHLADHARSSICGGQVCQRDFISEVFGRVSDSTEPSMLLIHAVLSLSLFLFSSFIASTTQPSSARDHYYLQHDYARSLGIPQLISLELLI